jgi:agmatinase
MTARIDPLPIGRPSFLDGPRCGDLAALGADVAIIGIPYTTPADLARSRSASSPAPAVVREQSLRLAGTLGHYDFEFGGDPFAGHRVLIVDCGDVAMTPGRYEENSQAATAVLGELLRRGACPIVLGGDRAATIPALRAYAGRGPICVVHLGADLAWRDEVNGVRESLHSAMRRAAELPWVTALIQIGLRGLGGTRQREVDDAEAFGSVLVRAEELHELGVDAVLRRLPTAPAYYISLDAGALDPAIAPGVETPAFGGLTYFEATNLLKGVAVRGRVVGLDLVGLVPGADVQSLTSLLGARLVLNLVGALAHAGQIGAPAVEVMAAPGARKRSAVAAPALVSAGR